MPRTARQETRRNGVLAQYFEFVKNMTDAKSTGVQKVIGTTAGLVPQVVLLLLSVAFILRMQQLDLATVMWVLGGSGLGLTGFATGRMWVRRRSAALARGQQDGGPEAAGEGERGTGEDREQVTGDSVGT